MSILCIDSGRLCFYNGGLVMLKTTSGRLQEQLRKQHHDFFQDPSAGYTLLIPLLNASVDDINPALPNTYNTTKLLHFGI